MRVPFPLPRPGQRSRLVAGAVAAVVVLGSLVPAGAASADVASYSPQPVTWGPCSWFSSSLPGPVPECATVTVPRDWVHPEAGPTLSIAISRVRASDPAHRKGILFTNPGGPGGSGIGLSWQIAYQQPKVAAQYDIIGMDPRGVGFSTQLLCDVPLDQVLGLKSYDSRDQSADAVASRQTVLKLIADSCAANPLTPYVNTWQTTHDMDLIRALLGESRLNYLGYSYGTWLGAKYAAVFPEHTGKVVLDSNTSWMDDLAVTWELMPMAFQLRWDRQFAPWVTRNPVLARYLGATPAQVSTSYEQLREAFKTYFKDPVWGDILDSFLRAFLYTDAGFVSNAIILAVYKVCLVDNKDLSDAGVSACINEFVPRFFKELNDTTAEVDQTEVRANLDAVLRGTAGQDISPDSVPTLVASAQNAIGDVVQIPGVFYAVRCGDGGNWHSPQWWVDYARRLGPFLPLGGYAVTQEVCSYWTLPSHRLPNPNAQKVRTIVTVQAEFDPATAYLNVLRDAAQFRGDRLISVDDAGTHGQYGLRGNSCVDDAVNGYLLDDVTPPDRSVCAGLPLPLETSVYPTPGPVDFVRRPGVRRIPIDPRIRHLLDKIIK